MDCEGSEIGYLNTNQCKLLTKTDILVEVHDFDDHPNIGKELINRLKVSHNVNIIYQQERKHSDFHFLQKFDLDTRNYILDELRPKSIYWIYFEPK